MIKTILTEYQNYVATDRKPVFLFALICWFWIPHFRAIVYIRKMQKAGTIVKRLIAKHLTIKYGIEVGLNARIGEKLRIMHLSGIVIGDGTQLGNECTIYQGVTFGQSHNCYPKVGNNVIVYPNSCILGGVTIGNNVKILANSVVTRDIPNNCIVAGAPATIIKEL